MTVINTNYSTLEEAWGGNFTKKKKKVKDPLCELYAKKNLKAKKPFYDQSNDPVGMDVGVYGEVPGYYDRSRRTTRTQKDTSDEQRIASYKTVDVDGMEEHAYADRMDDDDDDVYLEKYLDHDDSVGGFRKYGREDVDEVRPPARRRSSSALNIDYDASKQDKLIDLGLYVVSGILMICTMEQILQLGMRMK